MPSSRRGVSVVGTARWGGSGPAPPETAVRVLSSRLTPRIPRAGIVERRALVDRLCRTPDVNVVAVVAPAGYGKTTLLAQWAERDPRPFAWLCFDRTFNDPAVLLTYLAFALAHAIDVDPEVFDCLIAPHPFERSAVLAALASSVSRAPEPFVLVLDDVHLLTAGGGDPDRGDPRPAPPGRVSTRRGCATRAATRACPNARGRKRAGLHGA